MLRSVVFAFVAMLAITGSSFAQVGNRIPFLTLPGTSASVPMTQRDSTNGVASAVPSNRPITCPIGSVLSGGVCVPIQNLMASTQPSPRCQLFYAHANGGSANGYPSSGHLTELRGLASFWHSSRHGYVLCTPGAPDQMVHDALVLVGSGGNFFIYTTSGGGVMARPWHSGWRWLGHAGGWRGGVIDEAICSFFSVHGCGSFAGGCMYFEDTAFSINPVNRSFVMHQYSLKNECYQP